MPSPDSSAEDPAATPWGWDAEVWNSVLDTTCGGEIVSLLAPLFAPDYNLAEVRGRVEAVQAQVRAALAPFQLPPSPVQLLSVRELQRCYRRVERQLPEPLAWRLPRVVEQMLRQDVFPDLEVTLRSHPLVVEVRRELGPWRWEYLSQSVREGLRAGAPDATPDLFSRHELTWELGDRVARNARCVLNLAVAVRIIHAHSGVAYPLAAELHPLLALVQAGIFPLGLAFDGTLAGSYLAVVA